MRALLIVFMMFFGVLVSGCGQTGPLFLPPPEQEQDEGKN